MVRRGILVLSILLLSYFGLVGWAQSQQSSNEAGRKLVRQTAPVYPTVALKMSLRGTVRIAAVVSPDGTVKAVQPLGGNPILIQAAEDAVTKWKFAPAGAESRETVELHFNP
jgi:TonB family protein